MNSTVLALETSGPHFSIALMKEGKIIDSFLSEESMAHESGAAPAIDAMMKRNQLVFHQLHLVAVGSGPGSYSGLRIGMALASGISLAAGIPLASVGTLNNIAVQLKEKFPLATHYLALLPARKEEYFLALWSRESEEPSVHPGWMLAAEAEKILRNLPSESRMVANHELAFQLIPEFLRGNLTISPVLPHAGMVAQIADQQHMENCPGASFREPDYLKPVYISSRK